MSRAFRIRSKINKPVSDVFDAVMTKEIIVKYFADRASGDLTEGDTVVWQWANSSDHPVKVTKVVNNELIEFVLNSLDWQNFEGESYDVTVRMEFEELEDGNTMLSISESGWIDSENGISGSYDNCEGWTHMAMCLKAYLEHGIDLRL